MFSYKHNFFVLTVRLHRYLTPCIVVLYNASAALDGLSTHILQSSFFCMVPLDLNLTLTHITLVCFC